MTPTKFSDLGLSELSLAAIARLGYEQPSPIQAEAIPLLLQGRDLLGLSQTGSGKTAAFGLPAIELCDPQSRAVQVLILCPTRELAMQVAEECFKLGFGRPGLRPVPIYGGQSYERQFKALQQGPQIVIGTPGRVIDHLERGTLDLSQVRMLVLDEADRMLDMGFREDIESIMARIPTKRQMVCFSATMAKPILQLIERNSSNLATINIQHKTLSVPSIDQSFCEIRGRSKTEVLTRLIDIHDYKLCLIFCNTKRMADELADDLVARGYAADRIHGDMAQAQRERVMGAFRSGRVDFLVATDVAARGIDVDNIEVVFNYDLPWDEEDYVHRIGRTGRAGRSGHAISLVQGREIYKMQALERHVRSPIRRIHPPTAEQIEEKRANAYFEKIRDCLHTGDWQAEVPLIERLLEQNFPSTDIAAAILAQWRKDSGQEPVRDPVEPPRNDQLRSELAFRPAKPKFANKQAGPAPSHDGPRPPKPHGAPKWQESSPAVPAGDRPFKPTKKPYVPKKKLPGFLSKLPPQAPAQGASGKPAKRKWQKKGF
jgi:ATP-dependent RNA helicase DeaD